MTRLPIFSIFAGCFIAGAGCAAEVVEPSPEKDAVTEAEAAAISVDDGKDDSATRPTFKGVIGWGDRQGGRLTVGEGFHAYQFESGDGASARIDLRSHDGDTFLALFHRASASDPYRLAGYNDDCGSSLDSCLAGTLAAGQYLVLVTTYQNLRQAEHTPTSYTLSLSCRSGHCGPEQLCGSRGLPACPRGSYCDWPDQSCGAVDAPGVCRPEPDACVEVYAPVCGCDGRTYGNACEAASAGVDVQYDGRCRRPKQGVGETCGGIAALECERGLACDYSVNEQCVSDMAGVCVPEREIFCIQIYDPVCGCDGVTYSNDCMRRAAYAARAHDGPCR